MRARLSRKFLFKIILFGDVTAYVSTDMGNIPASALMIVGKFLPSGLSFLDSVLQHLTEFLPGWIRAKPDKGLSLFGYIGVASSDVHAGVWIDLVHGRVLEILHINVAQQSRPDGGLILFLLIRPYQQLICDEHASDSGFRVTCEKTCFLGGGFCLAANQER